MVSVVNECGNLPFPLVYQENSAINGDCIKKILHHFFLIGPGIDKKQINDWMYIDDDQLVGGYSIRLLYELSSPEDKADFRASVPFKLE